MCILCVCLSDRPSVPHKRARYAALNAMTLTELLVAGLYAGMWYGYNTLDQGDNPQPFPLSTPASFSRLTSAGECAGS